MSNPVYKDTANASSRNINVNLNYLWDGSEWIPQSSSTSSEGYILGNANDSIHKFGNNPSVSNSVSISSPETVWDGASKYEFPPDSGTGIQVKSSSNQDAQEVIVQGLDSNFLTQSWTGNLGGTGDVNIPGSWSRVYRAYNNGSVNFSGTVDIHASGSATSYAKIIGANNQTLMSIYTIPSNYSGYIMGYNLSAQNTSSSSEIGFAIQLKTREYGKVLRTRETVSVNTSSSTSNQFTFPIKLEPKTDIVFDVIGANGNNGSVNASFDVALL